MTKPITELDFDNLKTQIIEFIKENQAFKDYNFEGSTLNAIIDLLAYNTHTNAYYANMLHNESFIDTAQKRSSVVSRAKELGYTPRSVVCSSASIDLEVDGLSNSTGSVIYRGTTFRSSNEFGSFSFITAKDYDGVVSSNGTMKIENIKICNGQLISNRFTVNSLTNPRNMFTIPNKNIDTSTLIVGVRSSSSSTDLKIWNLASDSYYTDDSSEVYFLQESYDGLFQIYFGENIVGKTPENGSVIDISYIISNDLGDADDCSNFIMDVPLGTSTIVTTKQVSFGGSDKESIDSIRFNAKLSNTAKERAVSSDDYTSILSEKFNYIKSVSVWGGEDNNPPIYGKVFASLQPTSGYTISDDVKNLEILPELKKYNLVTITPELIDPEYISVDLTTNIVFDYRKTPSSVSVIETKVKTTISDYISSVSSFNTNYIESELINKIRSTDASVISNYIQKKIGFNIAPVIGINSNFKRDLSNEVKEFTISSTKFESYINGVGKIVSISEIPNTKTMKNFTDGSFTLIKRLGLYDVDGSLVMDIGSIDLNNGVFDITFSVYKYLTANRFIAIRCGLIKPDIIVKRNQIIKLDTYSEDSNIGLLNNNIVITSYV